MKRLNEKRRLYLMRCSRYQLKKRRNIVKKQKRFIDWFILLVPEQVGLHPNYVKLLTSFVERLYEKVENAFPLSHNRKTAIRGTLINWSVPLPKREAE